MVFLVGLSMVDLACLAKLSGTAQDCTDKRKRGAYPSLWGADPLGQEGRKLRDAADVTVMPGGFDFALDCTQDRKPWNSRSFRKFLLEEYNIP